jgi:polysaccharide biosynthesis protein PslH
MRILMITPALPYQGATNAGSLVMYEQIRLLAARYDLTLATFAGPDEAERDGIDSLRALGIEVHAVWRPRYEGAALWQRRFAVFGFAFRSWLNWRRRRYPRLVVYAREPEMGKLLTGLLKDRTFDLVQVEDSVMASYEFPTSAPMLLTDHEVRFAHEPASRDSEAVRWQNYLRKVTKRFDRVQVFTPRDAMALKGIIDEADEFIRVNPFGVQMTQTLLPSRDEEGVVFVAGFNHPPNVDAALWLVRDIMPLVWKSQPDVLLTLVGKEPPPEVKALAAERVRVTGLVPAVEPYMASAAVIVAPIRTGGGMRMKVLQAMAAGKALVTTSLGAEGLMGDSDDLPISIADDSTTIAGEVVRLLADRDAREEMGARACAFVRMHHGWDAYIKRLEKTYEELVAPR